MKKTGGRFSIFFVKAIALGLCLVGIQRTWAGVCLARGEALVEKGRFSAAVPFFEKGLRWDKSNPRLQYLAAVSLWESGAADKKNAEVAKARYFFKRLTDSMPDYARAWVYLGLTELYLAEHTGGTADGKAWDQARAYFDTAAAREPGSGWMAYTVGTQYLLRASLLSEEEKRAALGMIRRGIDLTPDYYHRDTLHNRALAFLWEHFSDFQQLIQITPPDFWSYRRLVAFSESRGLWKARSEVYPEFARLMKAEYEALCLKAAGHLFRRDARLAFEEFQKAYWIDQSRSFAKAGMLAARNKMDKLPGDYQNLLQAVLEDEEEKLNGLMPGLEPVVRRSGVPYLEALHAFRNREFAAAAELFGKVAPGKEFVRRYLAVCLRNLGQKDEAARMLAPALKESVPDLRELVLLAQWETADAGEASARIEALRTRPLQAWMSGISGKATNRLERKGALGMVINLEPGRAVVGIGIRAIRGLGLEPAAVEIRLWNGPAHRVIGTAYVDHEAWQTLDSSVESSGGPRWLEVAVLNPAGAVELDRIGIKYTGTLAENNTTDTKPL